jgi:hypothetical protein
MRQALLLIILTALWGARGLAHAPGLAAQPPRPQIGKAGFSTVVEWQSGTREGLLISNNDNGELRLAEGRVQGVFTSSPIKADFPFSAAGAVWRAEVPPGTRLILELRGGPTTDQLGAWLPLVAGDARSQSDDGALALESVRAFPPDTAFLQVRATFSSEVANASPVLSELTISYIRVEAPAGAAQPAGLTRVPAPYGPPTRTPAPRIILRSTWAGQSGGPIARQEPHGIILHQIGLDDPSDPLRFLRALLAYHTDVLGWNDMPFHFVIDQAGTIYEGHSGGPTAEVVRLAGGDAAIHIALVGSGAPSAPAQDALVGLLAWLGEAYDIPPLGQHPVAPPGAAPTVRPNIVAHNQIAPDASDPTPALQALVDPLRQRADQATVRARWYFAEGNTIDYRERLSVFNPTSGPASVRFVLLRQPGPTVIREATVPPGQRADLVVNNVFSDTADVPAIVEANAPVVAERFMDFGTDITTSSGSTQPARVWYFAEGSTDGDAKTFLVLFNPNDVETNATITYMKGDGVTLDQPVRIPPGRRIVVVVGDTLPGVGFGARVIAARPIVAERTMIFGPGSTLTSGGVHTAPGMATLSRRWYFAEGTTQAPFQMWLLVLNPNPHPANVAVTFLTPDGTSLTRRYALPPTTRLAINANEVVPDLGVATTISADRPVAAERAMYWKNGSAGMVTPGAIAPSFLWRFADGRTSGEFQEYLLLSNPNDKQARVTVELVPASAEKLVRTIVMPGHSRYTMAVHQVYPDQPALAATVFSTQPIVAERALYPGSPATDANRGGAASLGVPEVTHE